MHLITTVFCLLFFCCLWDAEAQRGVVSTLSVSNAGERGNWLQEAFCPKGYIKGFSMKVPKKEYPYFDDDGMGGIRAHCSDGYVIPLDMYGLGTWSKEISCNGDSLKTFSVQMKVPTNILGDDITVTNIKIKCKDGTKLEGDPLPWDDYRKWSTHMRCKKSKLCGIQIKADIEPPKPGASANLSNVKFFCCG